MIHKVYFQEDFSKDVTAYPCHTRLVGSFLGSGIPTLKFEAEF